MKKYNKKQVKKSTVENLCKKYNLTSLEAAILARREMISGEDILFYKEDDLRFMHLPFNFSKMEDAVERINQAIEEEEKILIFGDRDVDGIASTAILYDYLKKRGADVQCRLPVGEDSYGLSIHAIEDFASYESEYSHLIITVDCGISNEIEIRHANELGIDVIVTDHHNAPDVLPEAVVIINPKVEGETYPFKEISGAAVAYKLISALRFSKTDIYNQDFCLLDVYETNEKIIIECMKIRNLVQKSKLYLEFENSPTSIYNTKLIDYLQGQQILVWNEKNCKSHLKSLFGSNIDFQMQDMQPIIENAIPSIKNKTTAEITNLSKFARYSQQPLSPIDGFYNIFVTFIQLSQEKSFPTQKEENLYDLQLVGIAALADIMPMKNENRIFIKSMLKSFNENKIRNGLKEIIARSELVDKKINSIDVSWKITPVLNAAGRMGNATLALELLISDDAQERNKYAERIISLNEERKNFGSDAEYFTSQQANQTFSEFNNKFCIVYDERINRGITGILASRLMGKFNVPSIALSYSEDKSKLIGSMRSCRGMIATKFLETFGKDFFIAYGGHDFAAGFTFEIEKLQEFLEKAKKIIENTQLESSEEAVEIDAELTEEYITPELLDLIDKFEPYGNSNEELKFVAKNLKISDAITMGKNEKSHLKIVFDCGKHKFPALFWNEGERLNKDFYTTDKLNVIFTITRKQYKGNITPQMILQDIETVKENL